MTDPGAFEATTRCFVRVLGTRRDRFIEFEFALGDPDLTVELVMPLPEFLSFCTRYHAQPLAPAAEAAATVEALGRREGALALVSRFTRPTSSHLDADVHPETTTEVDT